MGGSSEIGPSIADQINPVEQEFVRSSAIQGPAQDLEVKGRLQLPRHFDELVQGCPSSDAIAQAERPELRIKIVGEKFRIDFFLPTNGIGEDDRKC